MQIENSSLKTTYQSQERGIPMGHDTNWMALKEKEMNIAFNMWLESAVFVLEMTEGISSEGRKYLINELKKNISRNGGIYPDQLSGCILDHFEC